MKCESCTKYDDCRTGSGLTWPCGAYRPKTGSGMDIEKMIEQLEAWNEQHLSMVCGGGYFACDYLCENEDCIVVRAATALSTLQAENDQLRAELYSLRPGFQNQKALIKQLRAELEKIKRERDAAIKDIWVPKWISCKNGKNCSHISAIIGVPDCAGCDNWEWRGQEEENQ